MVTSNPCLYTMTIGGSAAAATATYSVINPATEQILAQAPNCTREQLDAAVTAARRAQPSWAALPVETPRSSTIRPSRRASCRKNSSGRSCPC